MNEDKLNDNVNLDPLYPMNSMIEFVRWWWNSRVLDKDKALMSNGDFEYNSLETTLKLITEKMGIDFWVIAEMEIKNVEKRNLIKYKMKRTSENLSFLMKKGNRELPFLSEYQTDLDNLFYSSNFVFLSNDKRFKNLFESLNANGILVSKKVLYDKEIIIILGKFYKKNKIENDPDCFDTMTVQFIDIILNLIEIGYKTGRFDEAIYNYNCAIIGNNIYDLRNTTKRLLQTQEILRSKRIAFERYNNIRSQKVYLRCTFYNNSFFDEVMSNYIKSTLWIYEKEKQRNKSAFLWIQSLCEMFPSYGGLEQNMVDAKGFKKWNVKRRCEEGKFGFYISERRIWIAIGPDCKNAMHELCNVYQYLHTNLMTPLNVTNPYGFAAKGQQLSDNQNLSIHYLNSITELDEYLKV